VIPELGPLRLSQLRCHDVQALVDLLAARKLSGSRVRGIVNALRAVLRRPLQDDELAANPTDRLDLPADSKPRERAASPAEAAELLAALPETQRPLWAVAFYAGLRRGELRALGWSAIDDAVTEIRVENGWDEGEARSHRYGAVHADARPRVRARSVGGRGSRSVPDRPARFARADRPARMQAHVRLADARHRPLARRNRRLRRTLLRVHDRPVPAPARRRPHRRCKRTRRAAYCGADTLNRTVERKCLSFPS
jgi:integrase